MLSRLDPKIANVKTLVLSTPLVQVFSLAFFLLYPITIILLVSLTLILASVLAVSSQTRI
jgi:hypothetical protein